MQKFSLCYQQVLSFGRLTAKGQKASMELRGVEASAGGIHGILLQYILAYQYSNVKRKMDGRGQFGAASIPERRFGGH
jgi:hypothetical protein